MSPDIDIVEFTLLKLRGDLMTSNTQKELQADVPWSELFCELMLIFFSVTVPVTSFLVDIKIEHPDWFQRSGALMVLFAGLLAYRSLTKHYRKFFNNTLRGYPLKTSPNQEKVDYLTLIVSVAGTVIWGYGDKIFSFFLSTNPLGGP